MSLISDLEYWLDKFATLNEKELFELLDRPLKEQWIAASLQLGFRIKSGNCQQDIISKIEQRYNGDKKLVSVRRVSLSVWIGGMENSLVESFLDACCCYAVAEGLADESILPDFLQKTAQSLGETTALRYFSLAEDLFNGWDLWTIRTLGFAIPYLKSELLLDREMPIACGYFIMSDGPQGLPWLLYKWYNQLSGNDKSLHQLIDDFYAEDFFTMKTEIVDYIDSFADYISLFNENGVSSLKLALNKMGIEMSLIGAFDSNISPASFVLNILSQWREGQGEYYALSINNRRAFALVTAAMLDMLLKEDSLHWLRQISYSLTKWSFVDGEIIALLIRSFCSTMVRNIISKENTISELFLIGGMSFKKMPTLDSKHARFGDLQRLAAVAFESLFEKHNKINLDKSVLDLLFILNWMGKDCNISFIKGVRRYCSMESKLIYNRLIELLGNSNDILWSFSRSDIFSYWFKLCKKYNFDSEQADSEIWLLKTKEEVSSLGVELLPAVLKIIV